MFKPINSILYATIFLLYACHQLNPNALKPDFVTDPTPVDADDPAIWINFDNPMQSLILGTDKDDFNGSIYIFDLQGNMLKNKTITGLKYPNNIDVEYGMMLADSQLVDIAVFTERNTHKIRVLRLPEMEFIDHGGIEVFKGVFDRSPMGIALYKNPQSGEISAIVSRKIGPDGTYLWQYRLNADSTGNVTGKVARKFGAFKGGREIEAIAVDDALGYVYYSDEGFGVHKYDADPDSGNVELALFATEGFAGDHEGISIYTKTDSTGYILVSDQQASLFHVFTREGASANPHKHKRLAMVPVSTYESDGCEASSFSFGDLYPEGFLVAMSSDRTFQIYKWEQFENFITKAK